MRTLAIIGFSLLLGSCTTQKQVIKSETKTEQQATAEQTYSETSVKQTDTFGEDLKGESFIPADDTAAVSVESNGMKLKLKFKPKYAADGKLQGYTTEYQGTAKPTKTEKETIQKHLATKAQQSTHTEAQVSDQQKAKGSALTWLLVGAGLMLFLLLVALLWLYYKIKKDGKGI